MELYQINELSHVSMNAVESENKCLCVHICHECFRRDVIIQIIINFNSNMVVKLASGIQGDVMLTYVEKDVVR